MSVTKESLIGVEWDVETAEIDANDLGEDPLGVAARKDKATAWIRIQVHLIQAVSKCM